MRKILYTLILASFLFQTKAQDTTRLQEVVVVQKSLEPSENPYTFICIIPEEKINLAPTQTISELLKFQVGIDVRQRAPFDVQTDVSLRGGTFDQVLIMLDGVPMNDPQTGHHNMNIPINLDAIKNIEVIYNGGSSRYGPYAYSGVINIISKAPRSTSATVEIGSGEHALFNGRADVSYVAENSYYKFNFQSLQSDGYLPNTDFIQHNFQGSGGVFLGRHHLKYQVAINEKGFGAQNFYSSRFPDQYEATRTSLGALQYSGPLSSYFNHNAQVYWRRNYDRFELFRETGDGYYTNDNGIVYNDMDTISWYHGPNFHRTDVQGAEYRLNHVDEFNQIDFGIDARREYILSNNLGLPLDVPISVRYHQALYTKSDERINSGIFADYRREMGQFKIRIGARYNYNTAFGGDFFPSVDLSYRPGEYHKTWININRSFRLPTFTDLYYSLGGAVGSASLKPEYSNNLEIGYAYQTNGFSLQAALFRRMGTELIDWTVLPGDSILRASNITNLNTNGLNVDIDYSTTSFLKSISLNGSYQFTDETSFDFESLYVLDYLKYKFGTQLVFEPITNLTITLRYTHLQRNGSYTDFATNTSTPFSAVHLVDAKIQYDWNRFNFYVEANNLLDKPYYDRGNVLLPGRWARVGIIFRIL